MPIFQNASKSESPDQELKGFTENQLRHIEHNQPDGTQLKIAIGIELQRRALFRKNLVRWLALFISVILLLGSDYWIKRNINNELIEIKQEIHVLQNKINELEEVKQKINELYKEITEHNQTSINNDSN
ncbi:MAG: hypothetical protein KIT26_08385 [Nitrosomonas sp.]|nr:hypothetical protein [Nitrosomonas sp.]